jgi:Methyltransferase domain
MSNPNSRRIKPWFKSYHQVLGIVLVSNLIVYHLTASGRLNVSKEGDNRFSQSIIINGKSNTTTIPFDVLSMAVLTPEQLLRNPFIIPQGEAEAIPPISMSEIGHFGGMDFDTNGVSPTTWKWMVERLNIKSILDVGCGRGISTAWFHFHGLTTRCVDGSTEAREKSVLPDPNSQVVIHDFSRAPWWPGRTYDAVWCIQFLEHVSLFFLFCLLEGDMVQS